MSYQPHYIASFENDSGFSNYYEPFLLPEKAFPKLEDAVCWRGKVKRNPGYQFLGRLRRSFTTASLGNSGASPWTFNIYTTLVAPIGPITGEPNAQIETDAIAAPDPLTNRLTIAIGVITFVDQGDGTLLSATPGNSGTINYVTGSVTLTHTAGAGVATTISFAYFPGMPVMGLRLRELPAINSEDMIAFDQKYAYIFNQVNNEFQELLIGTTWSGSNSEFFWSTNYYKNANGSLFWATNSNMTGATQDPIRYYDGVAWTTFAPLITAADTLYQSEIILPYKGRLLFLNTWEGTTVGGIGAATNFPQRVRWSWFGDPLNVGAFRSDQVGKGGYLDAPTPNEVIISAEFVKDTLIVKFERSSWKLVYTGNEVLPFVFQQINKELGSESKFSLVPFDEGVFSISNYGATTDDSVNVERIDVQIPNTVFKFGNSNEGTIRVHGARNYYDELTYWTFVNPKNDSDYIYPNNVLVLNYRNHSYAIFRDSFTCYGTFQYRTSKNWSQLNDFNWAQWNSPWNTAYLQSLFPDLVAGTQHGFVEVLSSLTGPTGNNESLFLKSVSAAWVFTIPDHNLEDNDIIKITGIVNNGLAGPSALNGYTFLVSRLTKDTVSLQVYAGGIFQDVATFFSTSGTTYLGGGVITKINGFDIVSKVFVPFYEAGGQCRLGYLDFLLDYTDNGEFKSDVYINEDTSLSMTDSSVNTCLTGTNTVLTKPENLTLIPFQQNQNKIWHRQFVQIVSQNFQIEMSLSPEQNADLSISCEDFVLHALAIYLSKNARLVQ
jgi:hypothetical protein